MMTNAILATLQKVAEMPIHYLTDTDKRIHWLYLLTALLLAIVVFAQQHRKGSLWHYLFPKKVWWGKSARTDYGLFLFNGFVKVIFVTPIFYLGLHLAFVVNNALTMHYGYPHHPISPFWAVTLYTVLFVIINDFFVYLVHLMMHKVPFLWEFHKVHHSAKTMTPFTLYRVHPVELLLNNVQYIIVFGVMTGLFEYASQNEVSRWIFLGTNVLTFCFLAFGANLRHSHVQLRYFPWLEHVLISPYQHQIHHSMRREHWNKNMGSHLAIWDWMFGTLQTSKGTRKFAFGISTREDKKYRTFQQNLWSPFVRCRSHLPFLKRQKATQKKWMTAKG